MITSLCITPWGRRKQAELVEAYDESRDAREAVRAATERLKQFRLMVEKMEKFHRGKNS